MAITIREVAARAGVAPSTVSRVLAGSSRISPETQERVRRAMKELKYHPHALARGLARKSSGTLGLIIARPAEQAFSNPFFAEVIRGIGSVLEGESYNLLLAAVSSPEKGRQECLRMLRGRQVDGVILSSSRVGDRLVETLVRDQMPFVLIGRALRSDLTELSPVLSVNNDNIEVGRTVTAHLLSQARRRVAFLSGPQDLVVSQDRRRGYEEALTAAGLAVDERLIACCDFTREGGYRGMQAVLDSGVRPDAVFAADDMVALGALKALTERGLDVPGDVALAGVNDDPAASLVSPGLTTVRISVFDMGVRAAQLLLQRVRRSGEAPLHQSVLLPTELIVRGSSLTHHRERGSRSEQAGGLPGLEILP